jgi:hypothetical protein
VRSGGAAVSALTRQRAVDAARTIAGRGAREGQSTFGAYAREFGGGVLHGMGHSAGRAVIRGLSNGYGVVQGEGRPGPAVSGEDSVYAAFPNDGYDQPALLGCPEIALLQYFVQHAVLRFNRWGHTMTPPVATLMVFPLIGLEMPVYDQLWNSRTPTIYKSELHTLRFRAFDMGSPRARVRVTVWMGDDVGPGSNVPFSSRSPEFEDDMIFPHRFW